MRSRFKFLVLFGVLLTFLLPSTAAAQTMTAKEAAELVKEKISIPSDVEDFTSNYSDYEGRGQWEFQWTGKKETLNVTLDIGTKDIVSFSQYDRQRSGEGRLLPKVSKGRAQATAEEFLKKAVSSRWTSLKLSDKSPGTVIPYSYNNGNYSFYFERIVNGVSCPFNGAEFTISSVTGKITYYNLRWEYKGNFPPSANTIPVEKAAQTMKNNGFELMYFRPSEVKEGGKDDVKLVYAVHEPRRSLVNAVTGQFVNSGYFFVLRDSMYNRGGMGGMAEDKSQVNGANQLTPIEEEEVKTVAGLLSKEEAQKAVFKYFKLPDSFVLESARLFEDNRKNRVWYMDWKMTSSDGKIGGYISASVDAQKGELLSYSKSAYDQGQENKSNKYSVAEAKAMGEDFLKKVQPAKMGQVRYIDRQDYSDSSRNIMFTYARLVNGIPFYEDGLSVEVDRVTGEISSFDVQWGKDNFPEANPKISLDKAYSNLTKTNSLHMAYLQVEEPQQGKFDPMEQKIGLYYYFSDSQPRLVDTATGKVLMDTGEEYVSEDKVEFTDIAGTVYEEDIKLLYSIGVIGDSTGKFNPGASVVNADFIKMLVLSSGWQPGEGNELEDVPDTWYRPYYQTAVYHGVLSADSLPQANQAVTRMDCARWLVAASGLKKAAVLEGIYKVPAKDESVIPRKDAGYAAIALKMGLLPGINGKFEPDTIVTRGQAASILVKYMKLAED